MIDSKQPDFERLPGTDSGPLFHYKPQSDDFLPIVSILTPFYNTDAVFLETARSVLSQSLVHWEWIVVDDGSNDPAAFERLQAVISSDSRIRAIRQDNSGPSAARNRAFNASRGRLICLLDSDDLIEPTFLEKCAWFLEAEPEFGFCNTWSVTFGDKEYLWTTGYERGSAYLQANSAPPISLIRRELYAKAEGFDETIRLGHEDWDFWLRMASIGAWGFTIPEYLEWYRCRLSGRFFKVMENLDVHRQFVARLQDKYGHLADAFPDPQRRVNHGFGRVNSALPFENRIAPLTPSKSFLFVIPWMVTGGADRVNLEWIKYLREQNHRITICATLEANHEWYAEFSKLTPDIFILSTFLPAAEYPRFISYLIQSRNIDSAVISGSTLGYQLLPFLKSRHPGVAFFDLCHVEEPNWLNGGHPRFGVGYQSLLERNIVTTMHLKDWMCGLGANPQKIEVCYTGVETPRVEGRNSIRSEIRAELQIPDDIPVVIFGGRLCDQKRPLLILDVLADINSMGIVFRCILVGDGELREQVEAKIRELSLVDVVKMLGSVDHQRWLALLSAADILFMPSEYEGISVALLEAMSRGVVPVMSEVGGQAEIVVAGTGFLISKSASERDAYARALSALMNSPAQRAATGLAAYKRVSEGFSNERCAKKFLDAISQPAHGNHWSEHIPRDFSLEMAASAVEYARVSHIAAMLWHDSQGKGGRAVPPVTAGAVFELIRLIDATWIGHGILASSGVRAVGRWLIKILKRRSWRASG